ncbi:precorrin-6B methylase 1 [Corynebacterium suranareeae]|uniref:Precorrin-6B methylase 1 n=2 Tax=Corynebacterium suranareeae TaxID=2506452 RepID=A0A161JMA4_9CORY|nr:precorrin-6B methylase 1 [Corynebacterium suranareeae]
MSTPDSAPGQERSHFAIVGDSQYPAQATAPREPAESITLIGIGTDGFEGLSLKAQQALRRASVIIGSWRQLNLVPDEIKAERRPWPGNTKRPDLDTLFKEFQGTHVAVLASGDPLFYGVGTAMVRVLGIDNLTVIPAASSASLACARLGWTVNRTRVVSLGHEPIEALIPIIESGAQFLVLGKDEFSAVQVAKLLNELGLGETPLTVLSDLGSTDEEIAHGTANNPPAAVSVLNVIAVGTRTALPKPRFEGDVLDEDLRSLTVAALEPLQGQMLWTCGDPGAAIACDWLRAAGNKAHAISFGSMVDQSLRNARTMGVSTLSVKDTLSPKTLKDIRYVQGPESASPHAIFINKGLNIDLVPETAWMMLRPGGKLIAHATTAETTALLHTLQQQHGGIIKHIRIDDTDVHQWRVTKPVTPEAVN